MWQSTEERLSPDKHNRHNNDQNCLVALQAVHIHVHEQKAKRTTCPYSIVIHADTIAKTYIMDEDKIRAAGAADGTLLQHFSTTLSSATLLDNPLYCNTSLQHSLFPHLPLFLSTTSLPDSVVNECCPYHEKCAALCRCHASLSSTLTVNKNAAPAM